MLSDRCLSVCPLCNVGVLWPNGWMDQHETWHRGRPRPWSYSVRWGPVPPPPKGHSSNFRPMSVAKRSPISARPTAEHLFRDVIHLTHNTIFVSPLYSTIWLICTVYKFVNRVLQLYKLINVICSYSIVLLMQK